uniref:Uncharacterized protein n=1 Tax=Eutreptiella gymnastica TaxID=73025 RepID=A0A7S1JAA2_9EUGL|mmetsp:Transcript_77840/g.137249  ORF Transcript_77840/g.137249 Transcript_77840/m.137249 type:complete len:106 (-) Transcript_77840:133-450(-)
MASNRLIPSGRRASRPGGLGKLAPNQRKPTPISPTDNQLTSLSNQVLRFGPLCMWNRMPWNTPHVAVAPVAGENPQNSLKLAKTLKATHSSDSLKGSQAATNPLP